MSIAVHTHRPRLVAVLLATTFALTGCGSSSDKGSDASSDKADKTSSASPSPSGKTLVQMSLAPEDLAPAQLDITKEDDEHSIAEAAPPGTVYAGVMTTALGEAGFEEGHGRQFGDVYGQTPKVLNFVSFRIKHYKYPDKLKLIMLGELSAMQQAYPRAGGKVGPISKQAGLGDDAYTLTAKYSFGESHNFVWRHGNDVEVVNAIWGNRSKNLQAKTLVIAKKADARHE